MHVLQQGETTAALRRIPFRLIATADDSAMTGETPTVAIRKNYGSSAAGEGTVTELAGGLYYYEATADELDTLGTLTIIPAAEGAYSIAYDVAVVEFAPTEAGIEVPENFDALDIDESGRVVAASVASGVTVTTNNDKTGYALTSGERTSIATAVWGATTRTLSSFGTLVSDIATAVWGATSRTLSAISDSAGITTLLSRLTSGRATALDNLDAAVSTRATPEDVSATEAAIIEHGDSNWTGEGSGGDSAATIAEAVRSELATELGRIDAAVSSRLASGAVQLDTTQEIIAGVTLGDLLLGKVSILPDGEGGITVVDADGTQLFAGTYEVNEDGTVSMEVSA